MGTEFFISVSMLPAERLAYQVSMIDALSIDQDSSIYILDIKLGRVDDVISHLICIFSTIFKRKSNIEKGGRGIIVEMSP